MCNTATITHLHPVLFELAYKMVKCKEDAQDIVQDTWIKWMNTDQTKVKDVRNYLMKAVRNNCLSYIEQIKRKQQEFEELFETKKEEFRSFSNELKEFDVKAALTQVYQQLPPKERAVYLLKEVFGFDYDELQEIFEQKKENCRQMVSRAKQKLKASADDNKKKFFSTKEAFIDKFQKAYESGNLSDLIQQLKADILTDEKKV